MKEKRNIILVIAAISFTQGLQYFVSPILGAVQKHFSNADLSLVQMLITIPAFVSIFISILVGTLVSKVSKKKILIFACLLACITGFLPLLSDSFYLLFASRALFGICIGCLAPLNTAVVAEFYEGDERVTAMGIQAACIGIGLLIITTLSGLLGRIRFQNAYYINIIGFLAMIIIMKWLPDTGKEIVKKGEKAITNRKVVEICIFGFFSYMFLVTYSTNVAMHISGSLAGNTGISGILTGIYSAAQIVMGLVLGRLTKIAGKYVLSVSMFCFCAGGLLMVFFPSNILPLILAGILCGFAQGIYVPASYVEISNAVNPAEVALASSFFNAAGCVGQTISPYVLNGLSKAITGVTTTTEVFILAVFGMAVMGGVYMIRKRKEKE